MSDKIVNHFVLADGSVARYDYDGLLNAPDVYTISGTPQYELINGKYIVYSSGVEGNSTSWSCTSYIDISVYDIYVRTHGVQSLAGIAFYDKNKAYISGYDPTSDNGNMVLLDKPENAVFVRISCYTANIDELNVQYGDISNILRDELSEVKTPLDELTLKSKTSIEPSKNLLPIDERTRTFNDVTVTYSDGNLKVTGTATASGGRLNYLVYFELEAGTYTFSREWVGANSPAIFLQDNGSVVASLQGTSLAQTFTISSKKTLTIGINVENGRTYNENINIQVEEGATSTKFVKPSFYSAIDYTARDEFSKLDGLNSFWSFAMEKILCIGDSLTSGANYMDSWAGASIAQNYPYYLARMMDAETTNAGVSGITTQNWYKNRISLYTLANYDSFIIWLGTNGGLTDTLDTDVNPYTDYNDYADTETGNYCKIIEKIKADNPDAFIVLTKIFATTGNVATTNSVIDQIAEKYNLPVVDNSDLTYANYPKLHGEIANNSHFSKGGNIFLANRFATAIGSVLENEPMLANFAETPRTN